MNGKPVLPTKGVANKENTPYIPLKAESIMTLFFFINKCCFSIIQLCEKHQENKNGLPKQPSVRNSYKERYEEPYSLLLAPISNNHRKAFDVKQCISHQKMEECDICVYIV